MDLRIAQKDQKKMAEEMTALEGKIGKDGTRYQEMQREVQRVEHEGNKLRTERDRTQGNVEIYVEQSETLNKKLNSQPYRGVEEKHRRKSIETETTELTVKDLDIYYSALDNALQNFHMQKIKDINKIIRELWQLVYKGQDIDMIELESGVEPGATKTSKSYNYRVVMRKGTTPLDMRGRCSAGQRVLASVVIRLALAETFCINCGILTLDEPTTNLDEANKSGLAHALSRIIQSRSKQHNFQLICITHDEEFVKIMNTELSLNYEFGKPEYFFRISREEADTSGKFFSKIERVQWDEL